MVPLRLKWQANPGKFAILYRRSRVVKRPQGPGVVQFAQKRQPPLVIPKPALSARNLLPASSETADCSRENTALRNDKSFGDFQTASTTQILVAACRTLNPACSIELHSILSAIRRLYGHRYPYQPRYARHQHYYQGLQKLH
jgi:hypothetical protein